MQITTIIFFCAFFHLHPADISYCTVDWAPHIIFKKSHLISACHLFLNFAFQSDQNFKPEIHSTACQPCQFISFRYRSPKFKACLLNWGEMYCYYTNFKPSYTAFSTLIPSLSEQTIMYRCVYKEEQLFT